MKRFNIKSVVYTTNDGAIVKTRMRDYTPTSVSLGRQFISRGYVHVTRGELFVAPKITFDPARNEYYSDNSSIGSSCSGCSGCSSCGIDSDSTTS